MSGRERRIFKGKVVKKNQCLTIKARKGTTKRKRKGDAKDKMYGRECVL